MTAPFRGTLDYIFAVERPLPGARVPGALSMSEATGVNFKSILAMPTTAEAEPELPNAQHPSDHVPLMVVVDLV